MLYGAGLHTVEQVAKLSVDELINLVPHIREKQGEKILRAANASVMQSIDNYQDRLEEMKKVIATSGCSRRQ